MSPGNVTLLFILPPAMNRPSCIHYQAANALSPFLPQVRESAERRRKETVMRWWARGRWVTIPALCSPWGVTLVGPWRRREVETSVASSWSLKPWRISLSLSLTVKKVSYLFTTSYSSFSSPSSSLSSFPVFIWGCCFRWAFSSYSFSLACCCPGTSLPYLPPHRLSTLSRLS